MHYDPESRLPSDLRTFEFVIASHVLEHIAVLQELHGDVLHVINEGAILNVVLPKFMYIKHRMRLICSRFDYEASGIWEYTHLRWYTFESAYALLEAPGFHVLERDVRIELPLGRLASGLPARFKDALGSLARAASPSLLDFELILSRERYRVRS